MAVPKKRRSKARKRTHRSLWKINIPTLAPCSNCNKLTYTHRACVYCGVYKDRVVIEPKLKEPKAKKG